ncbi:hypothetical protein THAOC_32619, partial [Thalassiosira oceanica]
NCTYLESKGLWGHGYKGSGEATGKGACRNCAESIFIALASYGRKRNGNHWLPDQYSKPDPKAIARIIDDEKPRHEDLPFSAPESLNLRIEADRDLVGALQGYLAKLENNQ